MTPFRPCRRVRRPHAADGLGLPGLMVALGLAFMTLAIALSNAAHARTAPNHVAIQEIVIDEALRHDTVPPALALAVARVESNFRADALSSAGARGVMQIMPATGRSVFGAHPDSLWDARTNVRYGVAFLGQLYEMYGRRWDLALSHYNGGSLKKVGGHWVAHGYTRDYVAKVLTWWRRYQDNRVTAHMIAKAERLPAVRAGETPRFVSDSSAATRPLTDEQARVAHDYWRLEDPKIERNWRDYLAVADRYLKQSRDGGAEASYAPAPAAAEEAQGLRVLAEPDRFRSGTNPRFALPRDYRFN